MPPSFLHIHLLPYVIIFQWDFFLVSYPHGVVMICSMKSCRRWINITGLISCMENLRQEGYTHTAIAERRGCKHQFWHKGISLLPHRCALCSHPRSWASQNWRIAWPFRKNKPKLNRHCVYHGHSGCYLQQKNMCAQLWMCINVPMHFACTHLHVCGLRYSRVAGCHRKEICCDLMPDEPQLEEHRNTRPHCRTT